MFKVQRSKVADAKRLLCATLNNQQNSVVATNLVQKNVRQNRFSEKTCWGSVKPHQAVFCCLSLCALFFPILLVCLLFTACDNPAKQDQALVYYDVAGFINNQISDLSARHPAVQKTVSVDNKRSQQTTADINWSRELGLFSQADINKPALRNSYQIDRPDSLTYIYTLKPTEERLTVQSLTVRLDETTRKPQQIEAVLQTDNPLYTS